LSENFSERVRLPCENAVQVSCHGATSSEASSSAIDQPPGDNAVGQIIGGKRSVREVSVYSVVCPGFSWEAGC